MSVGFGALSFQLLQSKHSPHPRVVINCINL